MIDPDVARFHSQVFLFHFELIIIDKYLKHLINAVCPFRVGVGVNLFRSERFDSSISVVKSSNALRFG